MIDCRPLIRAVRDQGRLDRLRPHAGDHANADLSDVLQCLDPGPGIASQVDAHEVEPVGHQAWLMFGLN